MDLNCHKHTSSEMNKTIPFNPNNNILTCSKKPSEVELIT